MADIASLSDEELVEIVRSKDQEAYAEIVQRYEAKLLRYAMSFVRDEAKAQDILQNAFLKAFINLRGFNTEKKFSSWIYRIVHNETINEIKKYKREVALDDNPEILNMKSDETSADATFDEHIIRSMVQESLDTLPLDYRAPIALYYLEEKSYTEISDILRMPTGTVGTRISRGKALLKKIFEKTHGKLYG